MIDAYLKQLQEASKIDQMIHKLAQKLNLKKIRCNTIKDPDEKKKCMIKLRLGYAELRVKNAKKMLEKYADENCRKRMTANVERAKEALSKMKQSYINTIK
jgi:hypothetical protein